MSAVYVNDVTFSYSKISKNQKKAPVLDEVCLNVPKGSIYGLIGASGCGKTTLLRCIIGRLTPQMGTIKVFGHTPGVKGSVIPGPAVGFLPQELQLISNITIHETLKYYAILLGINDELIDERIDFLLNLLDLKGMNKEITDRLSSGQKRRVSLAIALIHNPPFLILDEPTVGVDQLLREVIWKYLLRISSDNVTVIITTHYIEEARHASIVAFMRYGRILTEGNPQCLIQRYSLTDMESLYSYLTHDDENRTQLLGNKENPKEVKCENSHENTSLKNCENTDVRENDAIEMRKLMPNSFNYDQYIQTYSLRKSLKRIVAMHNKERIRIFRQWPLLFLNVFMPALQLALFCICIGHDPTDIGIAVCNYESPPFVSKWFLQSIDSEYIIIKNYSTNEEAVNSVRKGLNWGAIIIDANYSKALISRYSDSNTADYDYDGPDDDGNSTDDGNGTDDDVNGTDDSNGTDDDGNGTIDASVIQVYFDSSNALYAHVIKREIFKAFEKLSDFASEFSAKSFTKFSFPVKFHEPIYGDTNANMVMYMGPGIIIWICFFATSSNTTIGIVSEKREGLERAFVAGVNAVEFIVAQLSIIGLVLVFQMIKLFIMGFWIFGLPLMGSYFLAISLMFLQGINGMCFGLMISSFCNREITAMMLTVGTMLPFSIITGMFWPIGAMPSVMRYIGYLMPQTMAMEAFRSVTTRGFDTDNLVVKLGFISSFSWIAIFVTLSIITVRLTI